MICAYDELYLDVCQTMMGDMYDYAVNTLGYELEDFQNMFLVSRVSKQVEIGNSHYVAGMNGCEVAREVISECMGELLEAEDVMWLDKSPEYWIGWSLAYYQWLRGLSFREIDVVIPVSELYGMYATLHEADISIFVQIMDEKMAVYNRESALKRLRKYAQLSQSKLAEAAEVPLRQIQLFEQGQRDIRKTQGQTLLQLAQVLKCQMEDLL